jgi:hypothetical protein
MLRMLDDKRIDFIDIDDKKEKNEIISKYLRNKDSL